MKNKYRVNCVFNELLTICWVLIQICIATEVVELVKVITKLMTSILKNNHAAQALLFGDVGRRVLSIMFQIFPLETLIMIIAIF